jgi:dephospho-CoA kinase
MLGALGAEVCDADRLVHESLRDPRLARAVGRLLGGGVLREDGSVDRAAVAARVFGPGRRGSLRRLEALLHPVARRGLRRAVASARRRGAAAVVLDVPLLFEGGADRLCDVTVFVDAPRAARLRRARSRGWTGEEIRAREARQWGAAPRRARADVTVDNSGSRAATRRQVRDLWIRALGGTGGRRA